MYTNQKHLTLYCIHTMIILLQHFTKGGLFFMLYKSTRGSTEVVNSNEAILKGLCDDGGLFVPVKFPEVQLPLSKMINFSYKETASYIFQIFFDEFSVEEINKIVDDSYDNKFSVNDMVNLTKADDAFFIELYHGPTSAFKDMALSALPHLMTESGKKISLDKELVILTATSGDTGKAALEGFSDVEGTKIVVFYPEKGVSNMQKLQMTTQEGKNVKVFGIKGNFDDAQRAVKTIFTDSALRKEMNEKGRIFSSANSLCFSLTSEKFKKKSTKSFVPLFKLYIIFCKGFKALPAVPSSPLLFWLNEKIINPKNVTDSTIIVTVSLFLKNFIFYLSSLLILSKFSRALPAPKTTQSKGASAICTGIFVSLFINVSKPLNRAPPPASIIPFSMMSAASSGGVFSNVVLIDSIIE